MSQVFSGDSVNGGSVTVPTTTETTAVVGNFLNPPFGNAKAMIFAMINLQVGTATTAINIRIRRNPNAENIVVGLASGATVVAGNTVQLSIQAADVIPDGRPVQYAVTLNQFNATGNGTFNFSNVSVILISG